VWIFKNKAFMRFAKKASIGDTAWCEAIFFAHPGTPSED
jgi:hypothetical protein